MGDTAHVFDQFAPKLTAAYHVYGITRRGFGASSAPEPTPENYSADRLGDDVLAVCEKLHLTRPVMIGHSIAGEELSSLGSRYPSKVSGLVYLDAAYSYAYYDPMHGDVNLDTLDLQRKVQQLQPGQGPSNPGPLLKELLNNTLPQFEKHLRIYQQELAATPSQLFSAQSEQLPPVIHAILAGEQKYTQIRCPVLAIFVAPHKSDEKLLPDPVIRARVQAQDARYVGTQADAFQKGVPQARIVQLSNTDHYVFSSNEREVLREIASFVDGLRE